MWKILFDWYSDFKVYIKWNNSPSGGFKVLKGTPRGGLSGVLINDVPYIVFCYLDTDKCN